MTDWNIKPTTGAELKLKMDEVAWVSSKMIATFTKLFPMSIVANSRWGLLSNRKICFSGFLSLSSNSLSTWGSIEKKATSDAEITAEQASSRMLIIIEITAVSVTG